MDISVYVEGVSDLKFFHKLFEVDEKFNKDGFKVGDITFLYAGSKEQVFLKCNKILATNKKAFAIVDADFNNNKELESLELNGLENTTKYCDNIKNNNTNNFDYFIIENILEDLAVYEILNNKEFDFDCLPKIIELYECSGADSSKSIKGLSVCYASFCNDYDSHNDFFANDKLIKKILNTKKCKNIKQQIETKLNTLKGL